MKKIHLDVRQLLGFKITLAEAGANQPVVIGARLGHKEGIKTVTASPKLGAKLGSKVGRKVP